MHNLNPYYLIIAASLIIIISYFFNIFSKKTSFPSVILLIALGIILKAVSDSLGFDSFNWLPILEILGVIGLIMIVLEAALDLKLKKEKRGIILKSILISLIGLAGNVYLIGLIIQYFYKTDFLTALIHSAPLSIMSSAIIIPSVGNLSEKKREFMIYESTLSDIFGIIVFYFLIEGIYAETTAQMWGSLAWNLLASVILSFLFSYLLIYLFQKVQNQVRLFLILAILVLLYTIGKLLHLSSLLEILIFGIILENRHIFFRGLMKRFIDENCTNRFHTDLKLITTESSFVVRTFFFVIFGMTLTLSSLLNPSTWIISLSILVIIFLSRLIILLVFFGKNVFPQLLLSPRGLITVLLFYAIPSDVKIAEFDLGIVFLVIIISSLIMAFALIYDKKAEKRNNDTTLSENTASVLQEAEKQNIIQTEE